MNFIKQFFPDDKIQLYFNVFGINQERVAVGKIANFLV